MTLKLAQFCDDPPKNIHKIFIPPKIFIFLKTPKNIEIHNFESQKIARAYVCVKISEYAPPPPHPGLVRCLMNCNGQKVSEVRRDQSSLIFSTRVIVGICLFLLYLRPCIISPFLGPFWSSYIFRHNLTPSQSTRSFRSSLNPQYCRPQTL